MPVAIPPGGAPPSPVRMRTPDARVRFERVDLADLASIDAFTRRFMAGHPQLDILVNNAAVMAPPRRATTRDGFELQLGTNHLGHFALTARLLPALRRSRSPRVVSVSSVAAKQGKMDLEDLQATRSYVPMAVYARSKLAQLLFALELQRRSDTAGWGVTSVAAHPGLARTEIIPNGYGRSSLPGLLRNLLWFLFQPAAKGALSTLLAATSPSVRGGDYIGPTRLGETRGAPGHAILPALANDAALAARLWQVSEELTGVRF